MLKIKSYVKVNSIAEAYELNQKKTACVLGGMVWLKMGNRNISTAIDLSGLGLEGIQETDDEFVIGCMTSLRALETDKRLNEYTQGAIRESVRHIVGVQFRNCATVGGSIWGRYGFSDVLTMFLGMDTWVELYNAGKIPLTEFVNRKKDNDILVNIIVRKQPLRVCYMSQRNTKTDFPVLTCSVVTGIYRGQESWFFSVGARPMKAALLEKQWEIPKDATDEQLTEYAKRVAAEFTYGSNMRGSAEYRQHLAEVLLRREMRSILDEYNAEEK